MIRNLIVLPNGTEIFSGEGTVNALQSVTLTQRVNNGKELTLGSTCANMLEATFLTPAGDLYIAVGAEITLYRVDENDKRTRIGVFTVKKSTRPSINRYKIIAYDRISWLDKDLTDWLESLNGWPYSLLTFADMVCNVCNLRLMNKSIPNGDWQIQKFFIDGITGRQLMQWVGQACGRFCRATVDGNVEFAWYTYKDVMIAPQGEYPIRTMQLADYLVQPVDKVHIQLTKADVGAVYGTGTNVYTVTGNYLLATESQDALQKVAQTMRAALSFTQYMPCKVTIPATTNIQPGDIIQFANRKGQSASVYVMTKIQSGQWDTLECTGSVRRDSDFMSNGEKISEMNGKVLELQMGIEGLQIANRQMGEQIVLAETAISQNTESIQLRATKTELETAKEEAIGISREDYEAKLKVLSDSVSINVSKTETLEQDLEGIKNGSISHITTSTGYTFDQDGLTINKSGQAIKTQITEDGMTVYKNSNAVLSANSSGVNAVDLHASTYLIVGKGNGRSRFEDVGTNRTGCFWVG